MTDSAIEKHLVSTHEEAQALISEYRKKGWYFTNSRCVDGHGNYEFTFRRNLPQSRMNVGFVRQSTDFLAPSVTVEILRSSLYRERLSVYENVTGASLCRLRALLSYDNANGVCMCESEERKLFLSYIYLYNAEIPRSELIHKVKEVHAKWQK